MLRIRQVHPGNGPQFQRQRTQRRSPARLGQGLPAKIARSSRQDAAGKRQGVRFFQHHGRRRYLCLARVVAADIRRPLARRRAHGLRDGTMHHRRHAAGATMVLRAHDPQRDVLRLGLSQRADFRQPFPQGGSRTHLDRWIQYVDEHCAGCSTSTRWKSFGAACGGPICPRRAC